VYIADFPQAGYNVVTTASPKHTDYLLTLGARSVIDYTQPASSLLAGLHQHGPYLTIFSAMDNPASQAVMGEYLASQGGGSFLTAKGAFGVKFPEGVEGRFVQYLDDFLKPELAEFTRWFYWEWLEEGVKGGGLKLGRVEMVEGGLEKAESALRRLEGGVSGVKLVLDPFG